MGAPERMLTYYTGVNSSTEIHDTVFAANSGPYSCMVPATQNVCRSTIGSTQIKLSMVVSSQSAAYDYCSRNAEPFQLCSSAHNKLASCWF